VTAGGKERRRPGVKIILSIVGIVIALMGLVWFLQGVNILPGSVMTGQIQWAIYGAIAVVVGIALIVLANRRTAPPPGD
jgi:uncharacterized membrane protein